MEGWEKVIDSAQASTWIKQLPNGDTIARNVMKLNLPAEVAFNMYQEVDPESASYMPFIDKKKVLKDWGPYDKVWQYELKLNWAVKYVCGMSSSLPLHVIVKPNWPDQDTFSYMAIPYDLEKNVNLETLGPYRADIGMIVQDP